MTPAQAQQLADALAEAKAAGLRAQAIEQEQARQDDKLDRVLASLTRVEKKLAER